MSAAPVVSVIILCYNQEHTIARAIESVLEQDGLVPYEIVIADDGSSDRTREICEDYQSRYPDKIRLLPKAPNKGIVTNYFSAFEECRGKYIADCAGDDYWCNPAKLSSAVHILENDPDANVVFFDFFIYDAAKDRKYGAYGRLPYSHWAKQRLDRHELLDDILNHTNALPYLLSASVYRKADVDDALHGRKNIVFNAAYGMEDLPVMAALAYRGDAVFMPEATIVYSENSESVSHSINNEKLIKFFLGSLNCTSDLIQYYGRPESVAVDMYREKSLYLLSMAIKNGDQDLVNQVVHAIKKWNLSLPVKGKLYLAAAQNRTIRTLIIRLKAIFRKNKSARRRQNDS